MLAALKKIKIKIKKKKNALSVIIPVCIHLLG